MKKLAVIAAMALLSVTTITACGNKEDKTKDNQTNLTNQDSTKDKKDNVDNNTDANTNTNTNDNIDTNDNTKDPEDNTDVNDEQNQDKETDKNKEDEQKELVETGKQPDFKVNKKGCFNGSYEGNDGCTYKFTKKGKLIITSDSETLKYEYTLNDDVISMIAEDGSFGTSRRITLLEDGTYLLDDNMGTQVILTYIES